MILLVRYGEIHLKGQNRPHFESLQLKAIKRALKIFPNAVTQKGYGRFYVTGIAEEEMPRAIEAVTKVFGLHSVSPAVEMEKDIDSISAAMIRLVRDYMGKQGLKEATFKVQAKRADKRFPLSSMQLAAELGERILEAVPGLSVDVHAPDFNVYVEVREQCYGYVDIIPCAGGMPQHSNGRAMLLLSGGIDSPVAGYMIAKRGVEINAVHYHSFPYTSEAAKQKVIDLAKIVSEYAGKIHLNVVSFTDIQMQIYEKCPHEMLVIIMRRFMMRIAQKLAEKCGAQAIVTGESIGQVASQTMESIYVTNSVTSMPVFRPLIGMDKIDIIGIAEKIGTYETSILPYEDCCTVFVPKHPLTRPRLERIVEAESVLDIDALVDAAVEGAERISIG
ncbi:tRNA uracil 4-sulfurtransferase ThiI [Christensenella tenuis]|jgi:tRNA uracil 4-sulfurtransferase|uniref:Probable tRNA sulfurtransferase n=1 Tax=Christensenella tenuis TaxID=2763033 RepID=A0ABR7EHS0_9FIRM|nr:tRNA uracil 4-sulfurtransferase ThiI [Christensenella tenuis]MBC5649289.1 tRNA 4-thiouridine(8) synthase ThiI [Christensenella tenuis]